MNHCTNCGTEFEGKTCPNCGKKAAKAATVTALRSKHALRLLHALLLIAFGALVIGLMAVNAFGAYLRASNGEETVTIHLASITFFEILTDETAHGAPEFACTVTLLLFAMISVLYGGFLLFTSKPYSNLKYTTILFIYLPVFIILCAFSANVRNSQTLAQDDASATTFTELEAGGISIFVLSVFFAIVQIALLIAEAHVNNAYIFEDREAALAAELGAPTLVPYPAIPRITDYSVEGRKVYYAERNAFNKKVDEHNANRKEQRKFHRKLIAELYQRRFSKQSAYPLAYLWWNFSA